MERRYPHYLMQARGNRWPNQVVCVAVAGALTEQPAGRRIQRETITSWHAVALTRKDGHYGVVRTATGNEANGFWELLAGACRHQGTTWVLSHQCARVWAMLDFWEKLEDGNLRLIDRDYRVPCLEKPELSGVPNAVGGTPGVSSASMLSRLRRRAEGYLVLEDPPSIARFKFGDRQGWLQWVDVRNWGIGAPEAVLSAGTESIWLASTFVRLAREIEYYGLGSLQATAGSQALRGFRTSYLKEGIYAHCDASATRLEGAAYRGGRCESFRLGSIEAPLWHYDFRSLYPAICVQHTLPVRLCSILRNPDWSESMRSIRSGCAIADVTLKTEEADYPFTDDTETIFPVGTFRTALAGPELFDALERGKVLAIHALATYQMARPLREYALALYQMRERAEELCDTELATVAKRLLVCLPGKFGQRNRSWVWAPEVWADIPYGTWTGTGPDGKPCRYRAIAGLIQREVVEGFTPDAVPALAAWITSAGRMKLLEAIRAAGKEHVYYVDTDSLFVDAEGRAALDRAGMLRPGQLGFLQCKSGPMDVVLYGIKHYQEEDRYVCAGLPQGTCEDVGDGVHYWYQQAPADAIRHGVRPDERRVLMSYARTGKYRHGVVDADGRVHPFRIGD